MKFLVDEQLPITLAEWIRGQGQEALHINELGLRSADDRRIASVALEIGAVIVTKDRDFTLPGPKPRAQVVWLRVRNIATPALLARLETLWPQVVGELESGESVVEVR